MASTVCGYCGRLSHMSIQWAQSESTRTYFQGAIIHGNRVEGVGTCANCGRANLAVTTSPANSGRSSVEQLEQADDSRLSWLPRKGDSPEFPDVPEHIATAAMEAHACHSIGATSAALLMSRAVVEATAKEKGIPTGSLYEKIGALAQAGHIRPSTKDAAHEIRILGNNMAHGDFGEVPDSADADDVLALMDEVLNEVFQGPARTSRVQSRRTSKSG